VQRRPRLLSKRLASLVDFEPRCLEVLDHALGDLTASIVGRVLCQEPPQKTPASAQGKADRECELVAERAVIHRGRSVLVLF
jgi:hypothetical protein